VKPSTVAALRARSGGRCERCRSRPAWSKHHRLPRGRGGRLLEDELVDGDPIVLAHLCGSGTTGCHGEVEHSRETPWVVDGYAMLDKLTGRPYYIGSDPELTAAFPRPA
jgi:hypothetical protein